MVSPSISSRTEFYLTEELNKTIMQSLVSSFGLDFLLFNERLGTDRKGGNVDTIHNVREYQNGDSEISISEHTKNLLSKNEKYNSDRYHSDNNYINQGKIDKKLHEKGELHDSYRNVGMGRSEKRQLDHVISASEVHGDAGRILAELDGVQLSNQDSNFQSTHYYINNLKSNHSIEQFLTKEVPKAIASKKEFIAKSQAKLDKMPTSTGQERHNKRQFEDTIAKNKEHIEILESIDHDKMRKADSSARKEYDRQINTSYYTSSKFLISTGIESTKTGLKMGFRQALGLILAEVWFEFKDRLVSIYKGDNRSFTLEVFLQELKQMFADIWDRVKIRCKDILIAFKDGVIGGVLSSLTTTITNIFFTTQKLIGKLLREVWTSLVSAAKLIFFNPNKLSIGDLTREVTRIITLSVSIALGVILNQHLLSVFSFPLGSELAAFVSAVFMGVITLGITYFLDHSELMQKVWAYLNQFKSESRKTLEYYQKVNSELDSYLQDLTALEFNLDTQQMSQFNDSLIYANSEYERGLVIASEIKKRNIELPFEPEDINSTRNWLASL